MSFLITLALAALQQAPPVLSPDEAVAIALKNAFSVRSAKSIVEQTRQEVNSAKSNLFPHVSLGATYSRFDREITDGNVTIVPLVSRSTSATLTLPIDITGNLGTAVRGAHAALDASKENLDASRNTLKRDVRHAYFQVASAKELVQVDTQALKDQQDRLTNIRQQYDAGALAKVDVLRQETQVSQAQADLISAENALDLSKESFNNTLGRPVGTPFDVQSISDLPNVDRTQDELLNLAQANRPELKGLKKTAEVLAAQTKVEERSLQPSLNLSATYTHNIDQSATGVATQTVGTLALTVPVFDAGGTRARVKADRQIEEQNHILFDQTSLGISLEVRQAMTNLTNARAQVSTATTQVTYAEEAFRLATLRLKAGEGILLEVIDAQTDLTRARTQLVTSRYNYLTAYSDLQKAVGADDLKPLVSEKEKNK